ncbi:MAG TPA: HAMP domain-containing sensor histidine kinase [Nitrososphaera sp.]
MSRAEATSDYCHDSKSPSSLVTNDQYFQIIKQLKAKGIRQRFITEITQENVRYSKELANHVELRHLEGVKGNFGIVDGKEYGAAANIYDLQPPVEFTYSNVKSFVDQQQYFFDMLWNKAIPAEHRIKEIEEGIPIEKTEVIEGKEEVINKLIEGFSKIRDTFDNCIDSSCPSAYVSTSTVWDRCLELNQRGVKLRFITEITRENISYCREIMKIGEVRHLDKVKGNFGIADKKDYRGVADLEEGRAPTQAIRSTVKLFVEQQQYFFETLWNKAIPAEQRIKEIEEGRAPEKLEIIEDTQKSISRAFDIMNKTQKELLVLFATQRTFTIALQAGTAYIYRKMSENGVKIKVLVPRGGQGDSIEIEENSDQQMSKVREELSSSINLRFSEVDLNTRITIMISDRNEFMSWELKDDTLDDPYLAGGVAAYSNIKALASSYATIFDNLWKITELAENLRLANIKLERNDKAMKEFINIAAHELRTPIQPILGLSEMLSSDTGNNTDPQQQRKLIDVIIRNAHKLENLAEDILDVTRIESGGLQLSMEKINLSELVKGIVSDFHAVIKSKFDKNKNSSMAVICLKEEYPDDGAADPNREHPIVVLADANRIVQVIANLLSNAVKFSTQRDRRALITVTTGIRVIDHKSMAVVSVSDQGQGINREIVPRLFQKFISGSEKGTGLGLYISKNIIEAHGGEIWAENNKSGIGATFVFTLPLLKS